MKFAENLKQLRKKSGMTQLELSKKLGTVHSTISMYERGEREPDLDTINRIAKIFGVSADYLLGQKVNRGVKIPVFGNVAAGVPIEAITDIEDYEEIPLEMAKTGEYAALRIKGSSMEPRMIKGDVVIVKLQNTIETGETAIVLVGDEATCKKIKKTPEGVWLISTNPIYEPIFYSNREIEELPVIIWGKVVELRAKY